MKTKFKRVESLIRATWISPENYKVGDGVGAICIGQNVMWRGTKEQAAVMAQNMDTAYSALGLQFQIDGKLAIHFNPQHP